MSDDWKNLPVFIGPDGPFFGEWSIPYHVARLVAPQKMQVPTRVMGSDEHGKPFLITINTIDGGRQILNPGDRYDAEIVTVKYDR